MIRRILAGAAVAGVLLLTPGSAYAAGNCPDGYTRGCHAGYPSPSVSPSSPAPSETPSSAPSSPPARQHSTPPQLPTTGSDTGVILAAAAAFLAVGVGLLALVRAVKRKP